jgi:hypothetical protein
MPELTVDVLAAPLQPVEELLSVVRRVAFAVGGEAEDRQAGTAELLFEAGDLEKEGFKMWLI